SLMSSRIYSSVLHYNLRISVQLERIVEIPLMDSYQAEIVDIAYTFNQPTDYAYEDLEEVIVYLRELEDEEGRIDAVDDVVINTDEPIDVDHDEKTEAIIE